MSAKPRPEKWQKSEFELAAVAADWIRAIRGGHSQVVLSRRLGYRSNIVYRWEAGLCFPTASSALRLAQQTGIDVRGAVQKFLNGTPRWLEQIDISSPDAIAWLFRELRGRIALQELASTTGISRFALSRWMKGQSQPTLPEFFLVVEKTSLRLLDFIATFTDPAKLPTIRDPWDRLVQSRLAAYQHPWSHAVMRALELRAYAELPRHQAGWIAARLNIDDTTENECLRLLERCAQIQWEGNRYVVRHSSFVDTRADPLRARKLKAWWLQIGLQHLEAGRPGLFAYNLCSLSKDDFVRIEDLQRKYYREMTQIIEQSKSTDLIVLYGAQLMRLDCVVDGPTAADGNPPSRG